MNSYTFLQQIRFGDKLKLEVNLENTRSLIAPLVLQMLVENAIKHNVISEQHPLTIRIYLKDDFVIVENDLNKKEIIQSESQGIGLENIMRRYEFLSDKKVEVTEGDVFRVKLPLIPE